MDKATKVEDMRQITKVASGWRVRVPYGYGARQKFLIKEKEKLERNRESAIKNNNKSWKASLDTLILEKSMQISSLNEKLKKILKEEYTKNKAYRRTQQCDSLETAIIIRDVFREVARREAIGEDPTEEQIRKLERIEDIPSKTEYLEEVSHVVARQINYDLDKLRNVSSRTKRIKEILKKSPQAKEKELEFYEISPDDIYNCVGTICTSNPDMLVLKNKKYIYTGSFTDNVNEDYLKCLYSMAKDQKIDGFILNGHWKKDNIFGYSEDDGFSDIVKKICKDFKVYSFRSNIDDFGLICELKKLGVEFFNKVEDSKNVFEGLVFSRSPNKDQMNNFRDLDVDKNIFAYSTYPHLERRRIGKYLIGCGSSSIPLGYSKTNSTAVNTFKIKSKKYTSIGGFLLRFDKDGDVFPSNFYYDENDKCIFVNGKMYQDKKATQAKLVVIVADVHGVYVHKRAFSSFVKFLDKNKNNIKALVINGDFLDNAVITHWDRGNIKTQLDKSKRIGDFIDEVNFTRMLLWHIKSVLNKDTLLYFKIGNHEKNSIEKFTQGDLAHSLSRVFNLKTLLELDKMGFEVIPSDSTYTIGYDKIKVIHGNELGKAQRSKELGKNTVWGHSHKPEITNYGIGLPCLQEDETATYIHNDRKNWGLGWAVVPMINNKVGYCELINIVNDKYFNFNEVLPLEKELDFSIEEESEIHVGKESSKKETKYFPPDIRV